MNTGLRIKTAATLAIVAILLVGGIIYTVANAAKTQAQQTCIKKEIDAFALSGSNAWPPDFVAICKAWNNHPPGI